MKHRACLYRCQVTHSRLSPRRHSFKNNFFWFGLSEKELNVEQRLSNAPLVGIEKFSLYKFSYKNHLNFGKGSFLKNIEYFLQKSGEFRSVLNFHCHTNLSFLGYVFNPMNLIIISLEDDTKCAIIEIGNTFNEIKPYFVSGECFTDSGFIYNTQKLFYISPFIDHRNFMTFKFIDMGDYFKLSVEDYELNNGKKNIVLKTKLKASKLELTTKNILFCTLKYPFNTLYVIFFIHFHALMI